MCSVVHKIKNWKYVGIIFLINDWDWAAVHPAVMGSWEEMWPYSAPLLAASKAQICKSGAISNDQRGNCEVGR